MVIPVSQIVDEIVAVVGGTHFHGFLRSRRFVSIPDKIIVLEVPPVKNTIKRSLNEYPQAAAMMKRLADFRSVLTNCSHPAAQSKRSPSGWRREKPLRYGAGNRLVTHLSVQSSVTLGLCGEAVTHLIDTRYAEWKVPSRRTRPRSSATTPVTTS